MPIFETFSKRQKRREQAGQADVYQYDDLPRAFRVQVVHIWRTLNDTGDSIPRLRGRIEASFSTQLWQYIHSLVTREVGVFDLGQSFGVFEQCCEYILQVDTLGALDMIDVVFHVAFSLQDRFSGGSSIYSPQEAIDELNHRFREHNIGYQFEAGELIRVDSQYMHNETVKPALLLLRHARFSGASDEFMRAHEHYRAGRLKEAIAEALKAFESTMKTICEERGWPYDRQRATAKDLIQVMVAHELLPAYLTQHYQGLRMLLEAGLPTVRNKTSGHGQGKDPLAVPEYFVAYALHQAAANIVFLVEAHTALP